MAAGSCVTTSVPQTSANDDQLAAQAEHDMSEHVLGLLDHVVEDPGLVVENEVRGTHSHRIVKDPGLVVEDEVRGTHSPTSVQRSRPGRRGRWARRQQAFQYGQLDTQLDNGYDAWMDHMLGPRLPTGILGGRGRSGESLGQYNDLPTGTQNLLSFTSPPRSVFLFPLIRLVPVLEDALHPLMRQA